MQTIPVTHENSEKQALFQQVVESPRDPEPSFQLAVLASRDGNFSESHMWWRVTLRRARWTGAETQWKRRALRDADMQAMWNYPGDLPWPGEERQSGSAVAA